MTAVEAFNSILHNAGLVYNTNNVQLIGDDPVLPTPYKVGSAGAAALASVGYAASNLWQLKTGQSQDVSITTTDAAIAQMSNQLVEAISGKNEALWDPLSGFYQTLDNRYIQLHCNFPHHRSGVVKFLDCADTREAVAETIVKHFHAYELETSLNNLGLCAAMVRTPEEWQETPQAKAIATLPLFDIIKLNESSPIALPSDNSMPLAQIRVLDLTRVIAGPVCARTCAELGATVMRVGSSHLPEIYQLVLDTARGKLSVDLDFNQSVDLKQMLNLIQDTDIMVQAYRPGAMDKFGLSSGKLAQLKPGLIYISLSAYSHSGPWANRHGYDSLVQSATGIAHTQGITTPKHLPCQTLDYVAGFISCFAAMEALRRRATEGGSYLIRVSLAQVAHWLTTLGMSSDFASIKPPHKNSLAHYFTTTTSDYGLIKHLKPVLHLSTTPLRSNLPIVKIGSSRAQWPK